MSSSPQLAILGGSGFYEMPGLDDVDDFDIETPYGRPSGPIRTGSLEGVRVAFLARHGRGHRLLPSEIPQRANFWALKSLGVECVVAVSAVGSLRADYAPGDIVVPDQLVDRTLGSRPATFFGSGVVAHVSMAEPFCRELRTGLLDAAAEAGTAARNSGSYIVIEGPAFGTRAESDFYRQWGASVVGMTALPEAKLAREAELCYAVLAAVTDYDAWHDGHEAVDAATVFAMLERNVETSRAIIRALARMGPFGDRACGCGHSLDRALVTPREHIAADARARLGPILARCLGEREAV